MDSKSIGMRGEKIAVEYLKSQRYRILDRNYVFHIPGGPKIAEIDIIAQDKDCFIFIEVKTIHANRGFLAQDKVNETKKWKVAKAAEKWLSERKIPFNVKWRIDVVAIEIFADNRLSFLGKIFPLKPKISHFQNVSIY
jgi:putative endonuclease